MYKPTWSERLYIRKFLQRFVLEAEGKISPSEYKRVLSAAEKDLLLRLRSQKDTDSMLETVWKQMLQRTVQTRVVKPGLANLPDLAAMPFSPSEDQYLRSWRYRLWALPLALRSRRLRGTKYYRAILYFDGEYAEEVLRQQHVFTYFDGASWWCIRCGRRTTLVGQMVGYSGFNEPCGVPIPSWRRFLETRAEGAAPPDEDDLGEDLGGQSDGGPPAQADVVGADVPAVHPLGADDSQGLQQERCVESGDTAVEDDRAGADEPSDAGVLGEEPGRDAGRRGGRRPAGGKRRVAPRRR